MRRTPPWVFVAGAMIQLAALGMVVYAMERWSRRDTEFALPHAPSAGTEPAAAAEPATPKPEPPAAPVPEPDTAPRTTEPAAPAAPAWTPAEQAPAGSHRTEIGELPAPGVRFGPPALDLETDDAAVTEPAGTSSAVPAWVRDGATPTSQLLRGRLGERWMHVVFHPDRTLRLVDTDGGTYAGRVVDAAADLREAGGTRTLQVRIGVAEDGRLQLSFVGGPHDAETVVLDDVVERRA